MNRILFTITLIFIFKSGLSQILNVEKSRLRSDTARWIGKVELKVNLKQQEIQTYAAHLKLNTARFTKKHYYILIGDYEWASAASTNIIQDGYLHLRAGFLRGNQVTPEFFIQTQFNDIRGLQRRNLGGAGALIRLIRSNKVLLLFGIGAIYEYEEWDFNEDVAKNWLWKNSNYLSFRWTINPTFHINSITYYQARFDKFFTPRISGELNINLKISNKFGFVSSWNYFFDEQPPVDVLRWTYTLKNGISYSF